MHGHGGRAAIMRATRDIDKSSEDYCNWPQLIRLDMMYIIYNIVRYHTAVILFYDLAICRPNPILYRLMWSRHYSGIRKYSTTIPNLNTALHVVFFGHRYTPTKISKFLFLFAPNSDISTLKFWFYCIKTWLVWKLKPPRDFRRLSLNPQPGGDFNFQTSPKRIYIYIDCLVTEAQS